MHAAPFDLAMEYLGLMRRGATVGDGFSLPAESQTVGARLPFEVLRLVGVGRDHLRQRLFRRMRAEDDVEREVVVHRVGERLVRPDRDQCTYATDHTHLQVVTDQLPAVEVSTEVEHRGDPDRIAARSPIRPRLDGSEGRSGLRDSSARGLPSHLVALREDCPANRFLGLT
jgi:hypothetical protein